MVYLYFIEATGHFITTALLISFKFQSLFELVFMRNFSFDMYNHRGSRKLYNAIPPMIMIKASSSEPHL